MNHRSSALFLHNKVQNWRGSRNRGSHAKWSPSGMDARRSIEREVTAAALLRWNERTLISSHDDPIYTRTYPKRHRQTRRTCRRLPPFPRKVSFGLSVDRPVVLAVAKNIPPPPGPSRLPAPLCGVQQFNAATEDASSIYFSNLIQFQSKFLR